MRSTSTTFLFTFQTTETTFALAKITHPWWHKRFTHKTTKYTYSKIRPRVLTIGHCHCVYRIHVFLENQSRHHDPCRVLFLHEHLLWHPLVPSSVCHQQVYSKEPRRSSEHLHNKPQCNVAKMPHFHSDIFQHVWQKWNILVCIMAFYVYMMQSLT